MRNVDEPLKAGDHGRYGELVHRVLPQGMRLLFMPSLAALLDGAEDLKRGPLTEAQVLLIRNEARVVVTPADVALIVEQNRGYTEVDPASPYQSWQTLRGEHR